MDSDKPSNTSSDAGNADDLIEEMAKLMGNSSSKQSPESETGAAPKPVTADGTPAAADHAASNAPSSDVADAPARQAPEPVSVPRKTPAAPTVSSASGDAPGWLPQSRRQPEPAPTHAEPTTPPNTGGGDNSGQSERREPSFSLRPPAAETAKEPAAPTPAHDPMKFEFGLQRETPRSPEPPMQAETARPEPQTTEPSPPQAAPASEKAADFDFGFGADRDSAPEPEARPEPDATPAPAATVPPAAARDEVDPIADLIRDQLDHPAPAPTAPEQNEAAKPDSKADSFGVPPVFGLGGDTSRRSSSGSDALDDIENLIGNAVRVDLPAEAEAAPKAPPTPAPVPQPAVRPHQPRPAAPQPGAQNVDAAEAAILAALASSETGGARQTSSQQTHSADMVADYGGEEGDTVLTDEEQPRAGMRWGRILMPLAALIVLGMIGYFGYSFLTATPPEGEAPVLLADSDPNKVEPEVDETDPATDSVVFSGDTETDGSGEQLVSRDQSEATGDDAIRQIITADTTENGLANRRVRTVTVRPDGTIVSGDDLVAGSEALPVDRPEVPALPDDAVTSPLADTEVAGLVLDEPAPDAAADVIVAEPANLVAVNGTSVPFPVGRPDDLASLRAAVPAQAAPVIVTEQPQVTAVPQTPTVVEQPAAVDLLGDLEAVTPEVQTTVPSAVDPPTGNVNAAAWVQLASHPEQAVANSEAGRLSRLYSSALGGRDVMVQSADLGSRGIWYRIQVPSASLGEAQGICSQIINIGGDCITRDN